MKICHFIWGPNIGGTWSLVSTIANEQAKKDEVTIFFAQKNIGKLPNSRYRFKTHCTIFKNSFDFNPIKITKTAIFFKTFDVLHLHGMAYPIFLAAILSRRPIIYTFHGIIFYKKGQFIGWRKQLLYSVIRMTLKRVAKKVTTVSFFMKNEIENHYFKNLKDVVVVHNCQSMLIDNEYSAETRTSDDDFTILNFSRLVRSKRSDIFLEIISSLQKNSVKGIIYGNGPEREKLAAIIKSKGLSVSLYPFTKNIEQAIKSADICIFPAENESFGIAALEALSCAKIPIVFRHGGGLVEIMQPVAKGQFVVSNVEVCVKLVQKLCDDRSLIPSFREECRKRARDFLPEKIAGQYRKVYQSTLMQ